ncbi:hypothetical protein Tco_0989812 [Tanacetum coccineum]|uniref:Uncharacterized protein n=1 Tax=Tanacetum coccineum TaxID=301880 RepID=A0ABQ5EVA7_9ASTR
MHLVIVKDDEIEIDAIPLATKPPVIVEYKLLKEGIMVHYQLIRADGSSKRYSSMIKMLQDIDKEDLQTLWKLVKTKHSDIRPEDEHERVLWGDLKVMFKPDSRSEVWRNLQGYTVTVWKLYDSCGVHFVRDNPLVSVEVLMYDKRRKSENKEIVPTEIELVPEQTQQGTSHEVSLKDLQHRFRNSNACYHDPERGKLIQKLLLNQKCMGYLVLAYYSISPTSFQDMQLIQKLRDDKKCMKKVEPSSRSKAIEDIISIGSFVEALVLNHYVLVREILYPAVEDNVSESRRRVSDCNDIAGEVVTGCGVGICIFSEPLSLDCILAHDSIVTPH